MTYDWWKDIGTGLMAVVAALTVGFTTIRVAYGSRELAREVSDREKKRSEAADRERYRDQLLRVIEPAVTSLVTYGNALSASDEPNSVAIRQLRADATARLTLVDAIADERDRYITSAILRDFLEATEHDRHPDVRIQVVSRFAGSLSGLIAQRDSFEDRLADVKNTLSQEQAENQRRVTARETAGRLLGR
ncbi:hypothetical protein [Curtobacterium sp. 1544]|uniref:hypothetical protein n=1 Tax=Curtobacterium sp. 1544 TaxID=3156417 RepID=UPI0033939241